MPAGELPIKLPAPAVAQQVRGFVAVLQRVPRLPPSGAALARQVSQLSRAVSGVDRFLASGLRAVSGGAGPGAMLRRLPGGPWLVVAMVAGAAIGRLMQSIRALAPEFEYVTRFQAATERLFAETVRLAEPTLVRGIEIASREMAKIPATVQLLEAKWKFVNARARAVLSGIAADAIEGMKTTAGLSTGGARIPTPFERGGVTEEGMILTLPGGGAPFTSPQNVIIDQGQEFVGSTSAALARTMRIQAAAAEAQAVAAAAEIDAARSVLAWSVFGDWSGIGLAKRALGFGEAGAPAAAPSGPWSGPAGDQRALFAMFPLPRHVDSYWVALGNFVQDPVFTQMLADARRATLQMEVSLVGAFRLAQKAFASTAHLLTIVLPLRLEHAVAATRAMNDALTLNLRLLDKMLKGSVSHAQALQKVELGVVALIATVQAARETLLAIMYAAMEEWAQAAIHTTAAATYTAAAVLAGLAASGELGGPRKSQRRLFNRRKGEQGPEMRVTVHVTGYANEAAVAQAVRRGLGVA